MPKQINSSTHRCLHADARSRCQMPEHWFVRMQACKSKEVVCMSTCLHVCMSTCLHVCMSACLHVCCVHVCMSACLPPNCPIEPASNVVAAEWALQACLVPACPMPDDVSPMCLPVQAYAIMQPVKGKRRACVHSCTGLGGQTVIRTLE
jgi:hypothetical protein